MCALLLLCTLLLYLLGVSSSDPLREAYLREWQVVLPPGCPPNIRTEAEIEAIQRFVSPVLHSGFGNMLYEMAAAFVVSKELGIPCVFGWWDQLDPGLDVMFRPYDGRSPPAPNITIKHIFPNMRYVDFYPKTRHVMNASNCFCVPKENYGYVPFPSTLLESRRIWMKAHFFDFKRMFQWSFVSHE